MKKFEIKNFILLTLAGAVNAFGVTFFLAPVKLYDSGISGTSMLLSQLTPDWMSLSVFLLIPPDSRLHLTAVYASVTCDIHKNRLSKGHQRLQNPQL